MTPLRSRAFIPALSALVVALVMTGCSPGETTEPSPEPTVATTQTTAPPSELSPTPSISTPDPSPSSRLDEEQTAAADTVLEFFRLKNVLGQDPYVEFQPLADITTGQTQVLQMGVIDRYREEKLMQTGTTRYYVLDAGESVVQDEKTAVRIIACTDGSEVDLVEVDTLVSVLPKDREFFVEWKIEVLNDGFSWKVGDITSGPVEHCGP